MLQEIYIINDNLEDSNKIEKILENENFKIKNFKTEQIDIALKNIPSLIIVDEDNLKKTL